MSQLISFKHGGITQQKLQKGTVRAIHYRDCQKRVKEGKVKLPDEFKDTKWEGYFNHIFGKGKYRKTISKTTACTLGDKNVDTCQGDSGGPLVTSTKKVKDQSQSRILSHFHEILEFLDSYLNNYHPFHILFRN